MHVQGIDDDNNENNVTLSACPGEQWCHYSKKMSLQFSLQWFFLLYWWISSHSWRRGSWCQRTSEKDGISEISRQNGSHSGQRKPATGQPKKYPHSSCKLYVFLYFVNWLVFALAALWLCLNCWWNRAVEAYLLLQGVPKRGIFRIAGLGTDYGCLLEPHCRTAIVRRFIRNLYFGTPCISNQTKFTCLFVVWVFVFISFQISQSNHFQKV